MSYKATPKIMIIAVMLGLAGCDKPADSDNQQTKETAATVVSVPPRNQDFQQILRGGRIYQQNCATCHGKLAQGTPNWRQRDAEGKFPAPPLDGTGHTWHHPTEVLTAIIKNGTGALGGDMPAWKDKLSDQDIEDVLAWIKAQWPDEIYTNWYQINQRTKQ